MRPHHIRDVLFTDDCIRQRIAQLVDAMADDCKAHDFAMVGILRGSFMFFADLVREINRHGIHPRIDFTSLQSYGSGTESSGRIKVGREVSLDVRGAHVMLVDDILDTGRTLAYAREHMMEMGAQSVRSCVLLNKPARRVVSIEADYVGFEVDDVFVVGYGLDYDNRYRELP